MKLPRIYEFFVPGQLVTIIEMKEKLERNGNTLRKRLSELLARGYISSVRQGLYVVCNPAARFEVPKLSPFVVGSRLSNQSFIGFRSALQYFAGRAPQNLENITVVSPTKFNNFCYDNHNYIWCQSVELENVYWVHDKNYAPNDVRISSLEKAIVDCLKRPFHCDDFDELLSLSVNLKSEPDFAKLLGYVGQSEVGALCNRLGYYLECLSEHWNVPEDAIDLLYKRMSKKVSDWTVKVKREPSSRSGATSSKIPSFGELSDLRSRWKIQFPRHFEGRQAPLRNEVQEF